MRYFVKTPWWVKKTWPSYIWGIDTKEKTIYLSFDDGPHPVATPFVLEELKKYDAKASFFCIGKNVLSYPDIYRRILEEGHSTGNHTQHHLDGWDTPDQIYLDDVASASVLIRSNLFRPPYGKIRSSQARHIGKAMNSGTAKIIMWTVLSGDFDEKISGEKCLENVTRHSSPGAIVVFHDSQKAFTRLTYTLPRMLGNFTKEGYAFKKLETSLETGT